MKFIDDLVYTITKNVHRNALFIGDTFYTYRDFAIAISSIRKEVKCSDSISQQVIGLVANDDLETYATILALWLEGKAYVPINPDSPLERNLDIIEQAELKTIVDSSAVSNFCEVCKIIQSKNLSSSAIDLTPKVVPDEQFVYILFTSGSTGVPKGVPITRANLAGFVKAFDALRIYIDENDRCLQMFDLTFDLSVMSYLVPFLKGACVFTIPKNKVKYSYIYELMEEQSLTVALMVPSILHYLRAYFKEIDLPKMRYSLFCGEALPLDITTEWSLCLPNAVIINVYGPTEDTIFCTHYTFQRSEANKSYNGILSIGKAMLGTDTIIIDDSYRSVETGKRGELCLSGIQLTPGYWKNEAKNSEAFFSIEYKGLPTRFYKTGDLCYADEAGDLYYLGRLDHQTKIQGFRVELAEIEFYCKAYLKSVNVVAIPFENSIGNTELGLVIEAKQFDIRNLNEYIKSKLPAYMVPSKIYFETPLPLNTNGKTDRKELKKRFIA